MRGTHPPAAQLLLVALVVVVLGACSGDDVAVATTQPVQPGDVVFGSGSVPDSVPDEFPVPDTAVISSTMVIETTGTTEMIIRMRLDLEGSVAYYEESLETHGYEVVSSASLGDDLWGIELRGEDHEGTIRFSVPQTGLTDAAIVIRQ